MVDTSTTGKSKNKTITEGDIATLLQRYDATTILRLLQEMSFYSDIKMDWNELVKKSTTGITSAREYQLLWRHLSYRDPLLLLPVEHDAIDDDSDMECELEASPQVSLEASVEAKAYVRVMAAYYVPSGCENTTSEAPLTINIPYSRLPEGIQEPTETPCGKNITFPVRLQKVSSPEMASQQKRKRWSVKEDEELLAALKRCGQGNWTRIAQGEFSGKRTASQLSQRWVYIRRRCGVSTSASQSSQQQTETLAANHALSLALDNSLPSKKFSVDVSPGTSSCTIKETQENKGSSSQGQQQSKPIVLALARASKSRVGGRRTTARSTFRLSLMVTANSAAAAACMGGVSPFASVPKVEPGKTDAMPNTQPLKEASTACLPRPSGSLVVPKVEPGKSFSASRITKAVRPADTRPLTSGNLKLVTPSTSSIKPRSEGSTMLPASTSLTSALKFVSNQRVLTASVPTTVLPLNPTVDTVSCYGGQREQATQAQSPLSTQEIGSRGKQATQAQSPLSRTIPVADTAVLGSTNQNLVDRTAVPSISGAGSQYNVKCEANNKVGSMVKVSNVCGESAEVATVGGTGQGV
ncbi:unnamed protein product [Eruca vesicaria subsp. sativa]|uniref:Uncharacterized protein n=1 Tax=Eruca vesicaria subsp. sativa TaxID=29727 RepID=A0ABC8KQ73_ERUVS|nr:unnamed protein product [Eruca vesicaria subsp. sativa]